MRPSDEQIRKFIHDYPSNLKGLSYSEVVQACNYYFYHLPIPIVDFDNSPFFFNQRQYGGWNLVYRGQPIYTKGNVPHQNISEISFVPDDKLHLIKKFGRANKAHEAMFYGSFNFATACIETLTRGEEFRKTGSAMVTIGTWKFETPLVFAQIPPSIKYTKLFYDAVSYKSQKVTEQTVNERNFYIRSLLETDLDFEILQFFGDAFAKFDIASDEDYYLTNYYADRVFNRVPGFDVNPVDGILYPSVSNSYEELNIVLTPAAAKSGLRFIEGLQVWVICRLDREEGGQFIPIQQNARADDTGKIKWRD